MFCAKIKAHLQGGGEIIKNKAVVPIFVSAFFINFLLFAVKLYVGLSANSISIYSDGINNLFDGLSSVAALVCFYIIAKGADRSALSRGEKTEQLLSFGLSVVIFAVGFVFLYNSAERLMYPTPVWFTPAYFYALSFTAAVKLFLFFFLKKKGKSLGSEVVRIMSLDSLIDFFVTAVTVVTLIASQKGSYSFDAFGGIGISVVILVSGVKSLKESTASLLNFPKKEKRSAVEHILEESGICKNANYELEFSFGQEERVYLKPEGEIQKEKLEDTRQRVYNETGINLYIIK